MKQLILIITLLLCARQGSVAQTKQRARSPFIHSTASAHRSGDDRGNAPANDDCANAQVITVTADCAAPVNGTTIDATQDGGEPICDTDAGPYLDVWYTFNSGSETSLWFTLTPVTVGMDYGFTLMDACGGAELECLVLPGSPQELSVTANTDYWFRVTSNEFYGPTGDFTLCISTDVDIAPPPPNDVCSEVTPQNVAIGSTATYTGDNTGATNNEGLGGNLAWEAFTLSTCADVKIDFCGTTPSWSIFWLLIYSDCSLTTGIWNGSYDTTACSDQNFTVCYANLAAGTYYVPILQNLNSTGPYTLHVSAQACGSEQASNDECGGAIALATSAICQPSTFTNSCGTQSLLAMLCDGSQGLANDDVWYSFIATASDMSVGGAPNGSMDIAMQLFSGTCANLTAIDCADLAGAGGPDDLQASGLTIGETYYLRVYDWDNGYAYEDPSYDLCVVEGLGSGVGVEEMSGSSTSSIYPNPTNGDITIQIDQRAAWIGISVIDATGRTVIAQQVQASGGRVNIPASGLLKPGLYVVRIDDGATTKSHRLIVR